MNTNPTQPHTAAKGQATPVTSHDLARQLLAQPNLPVVSKVKATNSIDLYVQVTSAELSHDFTFYIDPENKTANGRVIILFA